MFGWVLLAASLFAPVTWRPWLRRFGGWILPVFLSLGYVAALSFAWPHAPGNGGYGSLAQVAALFSVPGLLLAGWEHYLAFDLFVGRWLVDDGVEHGVAVWWLLPCLLATFLFGPVGFLFYLVVRTIARPRAKRA